MGIWSSVSRHFAMRRVASVVQSNPLLQAAMLRSSTVFDSLPLKNHVSEETKAKMANMLLERIAAISSSPNQVAACREALCEWVLHLATYQVLVLPPPPEEDQTGFRGQPGVTGELKAHLTELAQKNKELRELTYEISDKPTWNQVWDTVLFMYWRAYWFAETLNAVRQALDDCNSDSARDWYKPFVHAMCAWQEDQYRKELGLPSALDIEPPKTGLVALMYSGMLNSVQAGNRYPDLDWRSYYSDEIESGVLRLPTFE